MSNDLAVIIVSYNTQELLAECLQSVYASRGIDPPQVIVVDNASSDGSPDLVRDKFTMVRLITNSQNRGFAAAVNQGLRESQGRYLLLLNPDTQVADDALAVLHRFLEDHPRAGLAGPQLLFPDGRFQHSAFTFPTLPMVFLDFFPVHGRMLDSRLNGRYPHAFYERGKPFSIDHPLGAATMTRRQVLEQVGPLDEKFFIYCEEIDWCMRIKAAGWEIFCQPRAQVVHYGAQATQRNWGPNFVELHRSRYRLYEKHYSPLFRKLARLLVGVGIRREMARSREEARRGNISVAELEARLASYQQVLALP